MTSASEIRTSGEQPARPATSRMGPKPALTLERIADAAVAIADAEGIDAISMQRVAAEFGYTKMSLYRYVTSKDELVAAMIDRAVEEPPQHDAVTGWRPQLEAWTRLLAATWQRHPWLPLATMGDREMGPNELGWIDQAIAILAATALTPAEQTATVLLICGHIRNTQSVEAAGTQPWTGERQRDLVRSHRDQFQALSQVVDDTTDAADDRGRDFGLQVIVAGVEALLAAPARRVHHGSGAPARRREAVWSGDRPAPRTYGDEVGALGELLGQGVSSEVYAWTPGTVAKLFRPEFRALAAVEYERARGAHAGGAPCPAVHEMIDVGGRSGVVFDRLDGPSLLAERHSVTKLAHLHVRLHDLGAPELPQLTDTLASWGIDGMESGHSLFHGDLHPGNVLRHRDGWYVIDWSNGHLAPAAADVACSVLSIGYRGVRRAHASIDVHRRRVRAAERYLDTYRALRPAALEDFPMWIAVIGRLLLTREPDLAFADELTARWIDP